MAVNPFRGLVLSNAEGFTSDEGPVRLPKDLFGSPNASRRKISRYADAFVAGVGDDLAVRMAMECVDRCRIVRLIAVRYVCATGTSPIRSSFGDYDVRGHRHVRPRRVRLDRSKRPVAVRARGVFPVGPCRPRHGNRGDPLSLLHRYRQRP